MGCDIHWITERKNDQGEWVTTPDDLDLDRSYLFFGVMAGVRGERTPIAEPRGIPENASDEGKRAYGNQEERFYGCLHSYSWYTFKELLEHDWPEELSWYPKHFREHLLPFTDPQDQRLIFWFDS